MSKPNWYDAPVWARWLAMNKNYQWFWYEYKPCLDTTSNVWSIFRRYKNARYELAGQYNPPDINSEDWIHTREKRPTPIPRIQTSKKYIATFFKVWWKDGTYDYYHIDRWRELCSQDSSILNDISYKMRCRKVYTIHNGIKVPKKP